MASMANHSLARILAAQVGAEVSQRLRAPATLVTALALFVLSFVWIPRPDSGAYSIAWTNAAGQLETGVYTAPFVGASAAVLATLFLSLIGFYLVAGSVRRDRASGVGAILAASPLSKTAYLAAKWAAHAVYLVTLAGFAWVSGVAVWLRYGEGPFTLGPMLVPYLLLVVPGLVFTAAVAVFFEVTPGLRGKAGLVVFFFTWSFGFLLIPGLVSGELRDQGQPVLREGWPVYDPVGMVSIQRQLQRAVPHGWGGEINIGLAIINRPVPRVPWNPPPLTAGFVAARAATLLWALPWLALAVLFFDRFDPARGRARRQNTVAAPAAVVATAAPAAPVVLAAQATQPSLGGALRAEARLLWDESPRLRWLLVPLALAAALPGTLGIFPAAFFLLALALVIAEAGARESLAGTEPLVFSQPAVPRSRVLWKLGAVLLLVGALGLPGFVGALLSGPAVGLSWLLGLLFVATFAVGASRLTGGGKLFLGTFTALWYVAVSAKGEALNFSGRFGEAASVSTALACAAAGVGLVALAYGRERMSARA